MSGLCVSSVRWLRSVTAQDAHRIPCTGHANVDMCGLQQEPTDWGSKEKASQKLVAPGSAASKGTTSPITTRHSPLEHRPEQRSDSPYAPAVKTKLTPQLATPLSQPLARRPQPEQRSAHRLEQRPEQRSGPHTAARTSCSGQPKNNAAAARKWTIASLRHCPSQSKKSAPCVVSQTCPAQRKSPACRPCPPHTTPGLPRDPSESVGVRSTSPCARRGLGLRASQQHPPQWRGLTALASAPQP